MKNLGRIKSFKGFLEGFPAKLKLKENEENFT